MLVGSGILYCWLVVVGMAGCDNGPLLGSCGHSKLHPHPSVAALILCTIMLHGPHHTSVKRSYCLLSYSRPSSTAMELKVLIIPYSKSCHLYLNPRQFNQYGNVKTLLKTRLILSFYLCPGLPSGPVLSRIPTKSLGAFYIDVLTIFRGNCDEIFRSDRVKLGHDNCVYIYIYNKTSIKRNILTIKQNTLGSRSS